MLAPPELLQVPGRPQGSSSSRQLSLTRLTPNGKSMANKPSYGQGHLVGQGGPQNKLQNVDTVEGIPIPTEQVVGGQAYQQQQGGGGAAGVQLASHGGGLLLGGGLGLQANQQRMSLPNQTRVGLPAPAILLQKAAMNSRQVLGIFLK